MLARCTNLTTHLLTAMRCLATVAARAGDAARNHFAVTPLAVSPRTLLQIRDLVRSSSMQH